MATYKAISNGNADTLAIWEIWDGAAWVAATALPSASDDVYTNGYIVTITTSQSYLSFNRSSVAAPLSITQGGQFQIDGANEITLTGQVNGSNVNLVANNPASACVIRLATHTNKFHHIGDNVGGSASNCFAFYNGSAYNIDIIGNQNGGSSTQAYGFYNGAASTFNSIIGNQTGGSNTAYGFYNNVASTFESIIGNQTGGGGDSSFGFYNNATAATFTSIVGNQSGGSGRSAHGFYNNAVSTIFSEIMGVQSGIPQYGFYNVGNLCEITFIGSEAYPQGIYNISNSTIINFGGRSFNDLQTGVMAIRSNGNVVFDLAEFRIGLTPTLNEIVLYPATVLENPPATTDVRSGVVYGIGDAYTGTCAVPPAESVVKNVPVDDTVGTWAFDDDLILRLKKCSTTEEVDSTVAAYNT